jgi:hypothetical protein
LLHAYFGMFSAPLAASDNRAVVADLALPGYCGPCAPPGETHRYVFTLMALEVRLLDTTADSTARNDRQYCPFPSARHGNACAKVWAVQVDTNAFRLRPVREVPRADLRTCSVVHYLS